MALQLRLRSIVPTERKRDGKVDENQVPDFRVVSVIHDNDDDELKVSYDADEVGPFEALGLLMAGMVRQLYYALDMENLAEAYRDEDDD